MKTVLKPATTAKPKIMLAIKTVLKPATATKPKIEAFHTSRNLQIPSQTRAGSRFHATDLVKFVQNSLSTTILIAITQVQTVREN